MVVLIAGALLLGSTPSGTGGTNGVALGTRPGAGIGSGSNHIMTERAQALADRFHRESDAFADEVAGPT